MCDVNINAFPYSASFTSVPRILFKSLKTSSAAPLSALMPVVAPSRQTPLKPRFLASPRKSPVPPIIRPFPYITAPFSIISAASADEVAAT